MCTQCVVDAQFYLIKPDGSLAEHDELLPGWALFQAKKPGGEMNAGDWGLVRVNDPEFVWRVDPVVDPLEGFSEDEQESMFEDPEIAASIDTFVNTQDAFAAELMESVELITSAHALIESANKVGYTTESGSFEWWLCHRLGVWIRDHAPLSHTDPRLGGPH